MNPDLARLQPYPFEKLARLKAGITPPADKAPIALSVGEPKHAPPGFVVEALQQGLREGLGVYPTSKGLPELRGAIADWATQRFQLSPGSLDPERHIQPVNGTREALFSFTQALFDRKAGQPLVVSPNPFYQIYEGAALLAGAGVHYLNASAERDWQPDYQAVAPKVWEQCQLLFLCSPSNPTGAVTDLDTLKTLIGLADEYDFVIASDECYAEIYADEDQPPPGLLQACAELGRDDYARCLVFHSLSKRSNLPGLRSGFVAGDAELIAPYFLYRTYHGCAMPIHNQQASALAWRDETHVATNRQAYREKFAAVTASLADSMPVAAPAASFYLWPRTPISDTDFARELFAREHITVVPGSYLSREVDGINPGANHVRMALVAPLADCVEAAERIRRFIDSL